MIKKILKNIIKTSLLLTLTLSLAPLQANATVDFLGEYADAIHPTLGYMPPHSPHVAKGVAVYAQTVSGTEVERLASIYSVDTSDHGQGACPMGASSPCLPLHHYSTPPCEAVRAIIASDFQNNNNSFKLSLFYRLFYASLLFPLFSLSRNSNI